MEAIKGDLNMAQISSQYGVYATQIARWKKEVIEAMVAGFNTKAKPADPSQKDLLDQLYQQIGQLTVERDWLKKNLQPLDLAVHSTLDPYAGKLACTVFTEVDHSDEVPPDCFGLLHVQALQKTADPDKNQSELGA